MHLAPIDLAVLAVYMAGITLFGIRFRRGQRDIRDYFLGGRSAPWWALALSIVATETSTLTIIGTPATSYAGDCTFLQLVFGYVVGRFALAALFIPRFFRGEFYTAYQLIEKRFGPKAKSAAALMFLVTRALAEGVRVAAVALVVHVAFGTGQKTSIIVVLLLTLIYTWEGGMKAVIWTDVIQTVIYLGGSAIAFFLILHKIPGGWAQISSVAAASGDKLRVFDFHFSLFDPAHTYSFWAGVIGGTFLTMASHGTDQTIVQRLLAARSERQSKMALLGSAGIVLVQFALFLELGVMLFAFNGAPHIVAGQSYDSVFPIFIVTQMPMGLRGLVLAAIFAVAMSNASGSLNSLAASSVVDFSEVFGTRTADPARVLKLSRWLTLAWGAVLLMLGTVNWGPVLTAGLKIASITFGSLLGVFLLGFFNPRATSRGAIIGMATSLIVMLFVTHQNKLVWTWFVLLGTLVAVAAGSLASLFDRAPQVATREG
ncbi:MAG TPA: sodium:solute symporter [Candidatus Acidoferrales bacterium]|nr:sodium:solute symporter [Candidatus Acidoferrales bacterium]